MKSSALWYGYLEAGEKGSLVVRDNSLDTGRPDTFYLYNHKRDAILEYKASFVEPKLRELNGDEQDQVPPLEKAFKTARSQFNTGINDPLKTENPTTENSASKSRNILDDLKTAEIHDDEGFALGEAEDEV